MKYNGRSLTVETENIVATMFFTSEQEKNIMTERKVFNTTSDYHEAIKKWTVEMQHLGRNVIQVNITLEKVTHVGAYIC